MEQFPNNRQQEKHQFSDKSEYEEFRMKIAEQAKIIDSANELIKKMEADTFSGGKFKAINLVIEKEKEKIKEATAEITRLKEENRQRLLKYQSLKKAA